jgi:hypothetical protein
MKVAVVERLRQGPGDEARRAVAVTPDGPPPSRMCGSTQVLLSHPSAQPCGLLTR